MQSWFYPLLYDMLAIRAFLIPMIRTLNSGWLMLGAQPHLPYPSGACLIIPCYPWHSHSIFLYAAIEVYYFLIGVIKGVARIGMYICFFAYYFFTPHVCLFPSGLEKFDAGHETFVCAVVAEVERRQLSHGTRFGCGSGVWPADQDQTAPAPIAPPG